MKRKFKEIIYSQLREAQEKYGGYTGNDIAVISRKINRQPKTVRRQIEKLRDEDASFSNFTYIGKRYTDLTLYGISFLQYKLQDNCLMLKSLLLEELNKRRIEEGKSQIPLSTFYKFLGNLMNSMGIDENDHYRWLKTKGINERLKECERWLEGNYTGIGNPIRHYDRIKKRKHKLRSLLASIKSDESIAIQVRLIFKMHHDTAEVIAELLRRNKNWNSLDIQQKQSILRDEELVGIIDEGKSPVLECILTNRVINHIKSGKITFKSSYQFRDMGALIGSLSISEEEYTISPEMLNEMLEDKLEITAETIPGVQFCF